MKKTDLKRLEKAAEHYNKILKLLLEAEESIWRGDTERSPNGESTLYQVRQMRVSATNERTYLNGKIHAYKELYFK